MSDLIRKKAPNPATATLLRGFWRENPVFAMHIALCPTLAVTSTVANALVMGVATLAVLVATCMTISILRPWISKPIRTTAHVLIVGAWVSLVDATLQSIDLEMYRALGIFVQLIVVNCIVLGRDDFFGAEQRPVLAGLNAVATGLGFTLAMFVLGAIREVLGYGSFLGCSLFGPDFQPWAIMTIPAGGFLVLGASLLVLAGLKDSSLLRKRVEDVSRVG